VGAAVLGQKKSRILACAKIRDFSLLSDA